MGQPDLVIYTFPAGSLLSNVGAIFYLADEASSKKQLCLWTPEGRLLLLFSWFPDSPRLPAPHFMVPGPASWIGQDRVKGK